MRRTVMAVTAALAAKNANTLVHCESVGRLAASIAEELKLTPAEIETVRLGGLLHDVGKIGVPDAILLKSGTLDADERAEMRRHPLVGRTILGRTLPRPIVDCVAHHHEQPDGHGYPLGLKGDEIPFTARIIRVADVYDALVRDQPWRTALSGEDAIAELTSGAGTKFDATAVEALMRLLEREVATRAA